MKTTHPDDRSIQQFVFHLDTCDTDVVAHIKSCDLCRQVADGYNLLSIDLKEQEGPILDFNLEDLILEQILNQIEQEPLPKEYAFASPLIVIALGIIAILLNIFIAEFRDSVDADMLSTYFIMCIGLFVTLLLSMDVVRWFRSKMHKINFS